MGHPSPLCPVHDTDEVLIGCPCNDYVDPYEGIRVKLWFCPISAHRRVEWEGDLATCLECGRTNQDRRPGYGHTNGGAE